MDVHLSAGNVYESLSLGFHGDDQSDTPVAGARDGSTPSDLTSERDGVFSESERSSCLAAPSRSRPRLASAAFERMSEEEDRERLEARPRGIWAPCNLTDLLKK